jgi:hypothetical protein
VPEVSKSKETGKGKLRDVTREVHQKVLYFENISFQAEMEYFIYGYQEDSAVHVPVFMKFTNVLQNYVHIFYRTSIKSYNKPDKNGDKFFEDSK